MGSPAAKDPLSIVKALEPFRSLIISNRVTANGRFTRRMVSDKLMSKLGNAACALNL